MIEELRRFILTASNGNLTKTAEQVFITQSALTQSIQRLEKELSTKLFVQKGKTLQLTADGVAITEIGTKILELWEKAKNASSRQSTRPTYSIGVFDNVALRLGKYFQNNLIRSDFDLELIIDISEKLLFKLEQGILDIAISVIDKRIPTAKNLILLQTFNEELIPVSSHDFRRDIKTIPFILYNKGSNTRNLIDEEFTKKSITPKVFVESTSIAFMKELALLGSGVALLPENFVRTELNAGILKKQKLPIAWQREYGIYIQKNGEIEKNDFIIKELIKNLS